MLQRMKKNEKLFYQWNLLPNSNSSFIVEKVGFELLLPRVNSWSGFPAASSKVMLGRFLKSRSWEGWLPSSPPISLSASSSYVNASSVIATRVADPDPFRIRIHPGQWIRIRIRNPDPDPGGQKWPIKVEFFLSSRFEVLDGLFWELKASFVTWTFFMEA